MSSINLIIAFRMVLSAIALIGAAYVASCGKDGWGWLIFAAIWLGAISGTKD